MPRNACCRGCNIDQIQRIKRTWKRSEFELLCGSICITDLTCTLQSNPSGTRFQMFCCAAQRQGYFKNIPSVFEACIIMSDAIFVLLYLPLSSRGRRGQDQGVLLNAVLTKHSQSKVARKSRKFEKMCDVVIRDAETCKLKPKLEQKRKKFLHGSATRKRR